MDRDLAAGEESLETGPIKTGKVAGLRQGETVRLEESDRYLLPQFGFGEAREVEHLILDEIHQCIPGARDDGNHGAWYEHVRIYEPPTLAQDLLVVQLGARLAEEIVLRGPRRKLITLASHTRAHRRHAFALGRSRIGIGQEPSIANVDHWP